jgi:hypothetical protein
MKKTTLLICCLAMLSVAVSAQGYHTALGVRLGSSLPAVKSGITLKQFIGNNAFEAILSFGDGGAICGLYEIHKRLPMENLRWFVGFGGYTGLTNKLTNVGAAGILGIDYKFPLIPINITADWKPELRLLSNPGFESSGIGFSARYIF